MIKEQPTDVGVSHKVTMCEAICKKRYDWMAFLVKKWSVKC